MIKLKAFATLLSKPDRLKALLSHGHKGYLASIGWFRSFDQQQSLDRDGKPLPWLTYSFIDFITPRLTQMQSIFEYGSGNSTLFYSKYVKKVVAVEHDQSWFNKLSAVKPENVELIFSNLEPGGAYSRQAMQSGEKYDIMIIDGRDRVNCCRNSINALAPGGVLVLDDAERAKYSGVYSFMKEAGYKELTFSGISPGLFYLKSTALFYKQDNCLGI